MNELASRPIRMGIRGAAKDMIAFIEDCLAPQSGGEAICKVLPIAPIDQPYSCRPAA